MSGLIIDPGKCTGCGNCVESCPVSALRMEGGRAAVNPDACILCGVCVGDCPFGAIALQKRGRSAEPNADGGVWVYVERHDGAVLPVVLELLGRGRALADKRGVPLAAVLLGEDSGGAAGTLIAHGADRVLHCAAPNPAEGDDLGRCTLLARMVRGRHPEILLFGATALGRSLAPRLAARLQTGLTADCTGLDIDGERGLLLQTRPAFGGNLMATIVCPGYRPQMATVRPGIFPVPTPDSRRRGEVVREAFNDDLSALITVLSRRPGIAESIADAEVIVSVGRGIGTAKNLAYAKKLADLLGGQLGCSRPLVDGGWCEYKHQIGQTGVAVAPKLLIACGISGAIQHLAGISGAETVIAINSDDGAPIFRLADYKVVGDCVEILRLLCDALEQRAAPGPTPAISGGV